MATIIKIKVLPGSPYVPQFIVVNCSGLNPFKKVELLVDDRVTATSSVSLRGLVKFNYRIPLRLKYKLTNFGGGEANFKEIYGQNIFRMKAGKQSITIRYQI